MSIPLAILGSRFTCNFEGVSKLGDSYHTYWKGQAVSDNQRCKVCSINKASTVGTLHRHLLTGKRGLPWHCRLLK